MSETNKKEMSRDSYAHIKNEHMYAYYYIIRYNNITVEAKSKIIFIYIISVCWKSSHNNLFFYTSRPTSMLLSVLQNNTRA